MAIKDPALTRHLKSALAVAQSAAVEAGAFIRKKYGKIRSLSEKPNAGLVTEADRGSERLVVKAIRGQFPLDAIIGEESGSRSGTSGFCWHIDPLDGTTNFVHGFPNFCVSIGLEFEPNQLVLGVIYHPLTEEMVFAYRGGGAYKNNRKIRVSKIAKIEHALMCTGFSYRRAEFFEKELATFSKIAHVCRGIRRTGSAALDLAYVACGQLDGFWERGLASWDTAAGLAILSESGGKFTNFHGNPYNLGDAELAVTNGRIHRALLDSLSK